MTSSGTEIRNPSYYELSLRSLLKLGVHIFLIFNVNVFTYKIIFGSMKYSSKDTTCFLIVFPFRSVPGFRVFRLRFRSRSVPFRILRSVVPVLVLL